MIRRLLHSFFCSDCRDQYVCPTGRQLGIEIAQRVYELGTARPRGTLHR